MEIVRSLNRPRSWIYDTYFTLYRAILRGESPGEMSGGMMSGYHTEQPRIRLSMPFIIDLVSGLLCCYDLNQPI